MQTKVTIDQMRMYVRSLDERLIDTTKYPDSWVDGKISTAYEITATRRQPYLNQEVLDLSEYIEDGTEKFQVDMEEDVQGYKRIYFAIDGSEVTTGQDSVTWTVEEDQSVHVVMNSSLPTGSIYTIVFEYYYFPTAPPSETFISADVYHMLKHGMEISVYETLRDFEKMTVAQTKLEDSAKTVVNGLDIDIKAHEQWNGGFII